jgi:exonuclease V
MEAAGTLIGRRSFPFDARIIEKYVRDEMAWWKGERETKGVDIEEAFKCRICEFAESCTWRATKIEEGLQKARMRKEGRKKSEV